MSDKQKPIGPCNAHKNTNRIYLGPGEGAMIRDAIEAAHKWVHDLLPPDLVIRHRWSDNFEVHAHMLCYQSPYLFRRCKPHLTPSTRNTWDESSTSCTREITLSQNMTSSVKLSLEVQT
ncbi:uncharacterized protein PFLUO_LOCUS7884 [Penicillium psychrofluorescens]|uniref:uncharacterized protein n=1 Tax=Penicillium psychrofluorescens TaxID=3158075 RepID=UPI003CCCD057